MPSNPWKHFCALRFVGRNRRNPIPWHSRPRCPGDYIRLDWRLNCELLEWRGFANSAFIDDSGRNSKCVVNLLFFLVYMRVLLVCGFGRKILSSHDFWVFVEAEFLDLSGIRVQGIRDYSSESHCCHLSFYLLVSLVFLLMGVRANQFFETISWKESHSLAAWESVRYNNCCSQSILNNSPQRRSVVLCFLASRFEFLPKLFEPLMRNPF